MRGVADSFQNGNSGLANPNLLPTFVSLGTDSTQVLIKGGDRDAHLPFFISNFCPRFAVTKFFINHGLSLDECTMQRFFSALLAEGGSRETPAFLFLELWTYLAKKEQVKPCSCEKCEKLILLPSIFSFTAKINKRYKTTL